LRSYPDSDKHIEELVAKHWNKSGKGEFIWGASLSEVLENKQVASDFTFKNQDANLKYTHRRDGEKDIYFVSNQSDKKISAQCSFRNLGHNLEIWNADNGETKAINYSTENGITHIDLELDEYGSCFVVFGNSKAIVEDKYIVTDTINLDGSWDLKFDIFGEKIIDTTFTELIDWTVCENPDIKYHSGTVVYAYEINFKAKKGRKYYLDLGKVSNVAEVFINGIYVANLWKPSYQVDITQWFKKGQNEIEIHVTNTTINKLIGDERFPKDVRYSTNPLQPSIAQFPDWINNPSGRNSKRKTFVTYNPEKADDPLQPSGMVGPVRIIEKNRLK
jgi:hypothetical protein